MVPKILLLTFLYTSLCITKIVCGGNNETAYSSPTPTMPELCDYDFSNGINQPSQDVFIMDISQSISSNQFEKSKEFIRQLIIKRFKLGKDNNRIAVITVGHNATKVFDYITADKVAAECEFFHTGGAWDKLQYMNVIMKEDALEKAISLTEKIFDNAEETNDHSGEHQIQRRLWLLTDFHGFKKGVNFHKDSLPQVFDDVQIYGVGVNVNAKNNIAADGSPSEVELIVERFCNLTTGKASCGCNYRMLDHGDFSWMNVITGLDSIQKNPVMSSFVDVIDDQVCKSHDYTCQHGCQCREFLTNHDSIRCKGEISEESLAISTIALSVICSTLLIGFCLTVAIFVRKVRKDKDKRNKQALPMFNPSVATSTSDLSYEIDGYLAPSEWFQPTQSHLTVRRRNSDSSLYVQSTTGPTPHRSGLEYDNSLYQLPMIDNVNVKRHLYMKRIQTQGRNASSSDLKGQTTPHPYQEIQPFTGAVGEVGGSARTKSIPAFPYLEILPNNSNYEPVKVRLNAPQSGHSYQSFRFPTKVASLIAENISECESGYSSRNGSTENLQQNTDKNEQDKNKSFRHIGTKKFKAVASLFENH